MTEGPKVICAGRGYVDILFGGLTAFPEPGTEVYSDTLAIEPGGGAIITAAYLCALGVSVDLLSMLPGGPFGAALKTRTGEFGIGLSLCEDMDEEADPQVTVVMIHAGDRAFLTRRSGPAVPADAADRIARSKADHLHLGELATLVENPSLVKAARGAGMTVSLDCAWDQEVFSGDLAELIASVDVFFPNASEARALAAAGIALPAAPLTVIKKGPDGAEAKTRDGTVSSAALTVDAIDSTGAGDAFNAGFLAAWLNGADLRACLETGNRTGAVAVAHVGGATGAKEMRTD